MPKPPPDLLRALALLAAAGILAAAGNGLARTDRRLAWTGWAPPPASALETPALPPPAPAPTIPAAPVPAPKPQPALPARPAAPKPASSGTTQPPQQASAAPDPRFAPAPDSVIRDLSSEDAWAAYQRKIPFLDARRSADFLAGHVAGAWSVPIWEETVPARITEFEARANPALQAPIVIYCSGGDCEDSRLLAKRLVDLGYRNLLIYRDGFPDWAQRDRPQRTGPRP